MKDWAKKRILRKRKRTAEERDRFLIAQSRHIQWGAGRALDKLKIVKEINGDGVTPNPGSGDNAKCMRLFLSRLDPESLQNPGLTPWSEFVPEISPLLDYLIVDAEENDHTWKVPGISVLKSLQSSRVLLYDIIPECETREIVVGTSSTSEIIQFILVDYHDRER